jgi:RimJ/RimL family protein N-acetyltransferase
MKIAETKRLVLRNWEEKDRDLFHEINSDPQVMAHFPFRRTREQSDAFFDRLRGTIAETGLGFFAVALRETDEALGFCGLSRPVLEPHLPKGTVEIGWRLATRHWGKGYVTEAALELLRFGFEDKDLSEIVSFTTTMNARSLATMKRIGMRPDPARNFLMPGIDDAHAALRPHLLHAINKYDWQQKGR